MGPCWGPKTGAAGQALAGQCVCVASVVFTWVYHGSTLGGGRCYSSAARFSCHEITHGILQETFACVGMFVLRVMSIFASTPCIFKLGLIGTQCLQRSAFQIICHVRKWL